MCLWCVCVCVCVRLHSCVSVCLPPLASLTVEADDLDHGEAEERQRSHVHLDQHSGYQEHHQDDRQAARDTQLLRDPAGGRGHNFCITIRNWIRWRDLKKPHLLICAVLVYFLFICDGTEEHVLKVDMSLLNQEVCLLLYFAVGNG